ncbi:Lipocalin-like domain-containing protein [Reichenbachiella agariperforans]|uniref:Lipocalin-like domain-containing protein n=2 Tax=Reichenbachiellaceae TaxID=2762302 RepID=A0A1M6R9M3_REIAG|nr:Lipocalin-like domain-containing protein [Reichenbachiella agariperforans]
MAIGVGVILLASCASTVEKTNPLIGTWELQTGTIIRGGDTTVTDYTVGQRMIKIINATHFAFLKHDLTKGVDSTATYVAGGGTYELEGKQYIEHLEFLNYREWEGNTFDFTIEITGDTLVQQGREDIPSLGVEQYNIECYVRARN